MNEVTNTGGINTGRSLAGAVSASSSSAKESSVSGGNILPPDTGSAAKVLPTKSRVEHQVNIQESLAAAVAQMNEYVQSTQRDLQFSYDAASGDTIVRVLDRSTKEVIRQIPDEVFLKLARNLTAEEPIHLFSARA